MLGVITTTIIYLVHVMAYFKFNVNKYMYYNFDTKKTFQLVLYLQN